MSDTMKHNKILSQQKYYKYIFNDTLFIIEYMLYIIIVSSEKYKGIIGIIKNGDPNKIKISLFNWVVMYNKW